MCMSAHRATHLLLHSTLSFASSIALSHDISRPLNSFLTVSVQFFRGLPLLFLPQEPNAISCWLFCPCPCATRGQATVVFSILLSRPLPYRLLLFVILSRRDT